MFDGIRNYTGYDSWPYKGLDVDDDEVILEPSDGPDFNWSPVQ